MTPETVLTVGHGALMTTVLLAAPLLLAALIVGLVVGMFQAATQINEMTLSFIPKLAVLVAVLFVTGPWLLTTMIEYTQNLITVVVPDSLNN
jgi:flagellar biosynthetic protein FliQ